MFYFSLVFMSFVFIWIHGTLLRFHYDSLMYLTWSSYLPVSLNYLIFVVVFHFD